MSCSSLHITFKFRKVKRVESLCAFINISEEMDLTGDKYSSKNNGNYKKKFNRFKPYNNGHTVEDGEKRTFISPYAPPVTRLLARRYTLTSKKYLEIGINVKNDGTSYVEIAFAEFAKKEILLDLKAWEQIMKHKALIVEYMESKTITETTAVKINSKITMKFGIYQDIRTVNLLEDGNALISTGKTFLFLLSLNNCIQSHYKLLQNITETVSDKIETFKEILKNNRTIMDITQHDSYDESSVVDSELLALYFSK